MKCTATITKSDARAARASCRWGVGLKNVMASGKHVASGLSNAYSDHVLRVLSSTLERIFGDIPVDVCSDFLTTRFILEALIQTV